MKRRKKKRVRAKIVVKTVVKTLQMTLKKERKLLLNGEPMLTKCLLLLWEMLMDRN